MPSLVSSIPFNERLKSIPSFFGIRLEEEPRFYVLLKVGEIQIRKYYPFSVAQTFVKGSYEFSSRTGFYRLANYIFGYNSDQEKMNMTAPVFMEPKDDGWFMSFVLPTRYKFNQLAKPLIRKIELIKVPTTIVATIRYPGKNNETKSQEKSRELLAWLDTQDDYIAISEPRFAQYDAPFAIPFLRRNEVHVSIQEIPRTKRRDH